MEAPARCLAGKGLADGQCSSFGFLSPQLLEVSQDFPLGLLYIIKVRSLHPMFVELPSD